MVEGEFTLDEALAWDPIVEQLARQAPIWEPGTKHGYHMRTFGWLVGELIRRVTRHDARPVPAATRSPTRSASTSGSACPRSSSRASRGSSRPRTDMRAALAPLRDRLLLARVFDNPGGHFNYDDMWNTRALHAAELPSSNGIGRRARPSRGCTRRCVGDGVDGVRTLQPATVAAGDGREQVRGPDAVIIEETAFGLGFMLGIELRRGQSRLRVRSRRRGRFVVVRRSEHGRRRSAT